MALSTDGSGGWVLDPEATASGAIERVGGKAANLARLQRAGWTVPSWFVVPADAFRRVLAETGLDARIETRLIVAAGSGDDDPATAEASWREAGAEIRSWILEIDLPAGMEEALEAAWEARCASPLRGLLIVFRAAMVMFCHKPPLGSRTPIW